MISFCFIFNLWNSLKHYIGILRPVKLLFNNFSNIQEEFQVCVEIQTLLNTIQHAIELIEERYQKHFQCYDLSSKHT